LTHLHGDMPAVTSINPFQCKLQEHSLITTDFTNPNIGKYFAWLIGVNANDSMLVV